MSPGPPMDEHRLSQMMRVQQMLLAGPVCATTFLREFMSAGRSRVSDLRRKHGWVIDTPNCDRHDNHTTRTIMYVVVHGPSCRCPRCDSARFGRSMFREEANGQGVLV